MTSSEIVDSMVLKALSREGTPDKPIFSSSTFASVMRKEFDLRYTPSLGLVNPVLGQLPYLERMGACWWRVRRCPRGSMLSQELLD